MNKIKKIILISIGIVIFISVLNVAINYWVELKLPQLLNNKNNTVHQIDYEAIDLSLWNFKITVNHLKISPKTTLENSDKKFGAYGTIELLEVNGFDLWSILFGEKIKASSLLISKPILLLYKKEENTLNDYKNFNSKVMEPFEKTIVVSDLILNEGDLTILSYEDENILLKAHNVNFKVEGIVLNEKTINKKIPFSYHKYFLNCDSLYYGDNAFYTIKSNQLSATKNGLNLKDFQLKPKYSRRDFVQKIPKEKDLYSIFAEEISLNNMAWGFKKDTFFFKTQSVAIHQMNATIFRSKIPEDDLSKKELYNNLLRNLNADIKVDTLQIKNSFLTYEEGKTFENEPGKLIFSDFNMFVQDIESGLNKSKLPDVKIKVNCNFMKKSPLKIDWSFNVLDKTEGFKINGSIFKFDAKELEIFTKPYINIKINGALEEVYFNFVGNDLINKGDFSLKYDDLKVVIYKGNKRVEKNKFLSAIGNLIVKDDSNKELKTVKIEVKRNQEKSFYNFLWISIADGLKQILI